MRPTELQFKSPLQRTPAPYDQAMTRGGHPLNFPPTAVHDKSRKRSFPSEDRFRQYSQWARVTG